MREIIELNQQVTDIMNEQQEYLRAYLQFCNKICSHVANNTELDRDYIVKCIQAVDHKLEELGSKRLK